MRRAFHLWIDFSHSRLSDSAQHTASTSQLRNPRTRSTNASTPARGGRAESSAIEDTNAVDVAAGTRGELGVEEARALRAQALLWRVRSSVAAWSVSCRARWNLGDADARPASGSL